MRHGLVVASRRLCHAAPHWWSANCALSARGKLGNFVTWSNAGLCRVYMPPRPLHPTAPCRPPLEVRRCCCRLRARGCQLSQPVSIRGMKAAAISAAVAHRHRLPLRLLRRCWVHRRRCSRSARCQLTEAPTQAISELLYGGSVPRRQAPRLPRCRRQSPQAVHQPRPQPRSHFLRCHRCKAHPRGPAASEMPLRSPATSPSMSAPSFVHDSASARENTQQKSIRVRCGIASMTKCRGDFVVDNACCREGVITNEYRRFLPFMHSLRVSDPNATRIKKRVHFTALH